MSWGRMTFSPLGESAVVVTFGEKIERETNLRVHAAARCLEQHPFPGLIEYVPAFVTLTVYYDPYRVYRSMQEQAERSWEVGDSPFCYVCSLLQKMFAHLEEGKEEEADVVEIPVCYGGEFGPDLEEVARYHGLTRDEVIQIHSRGVYTVYMIGFAPGFPFLGGLSERIATPRRATPRMVIPAGSVGIAGRQTGVYPLETPGGWQLIGRTPIALFRPERTPPSLLKAGDTVRFRPISRAEYTAWEEGKA